VQKFFGSLGSVPRCARKSKEKGCFRDVLPVPIIYSCMTALGLSLARFAVLIVICVEIGLITPQVDLNVYII